MSTPDYSGKVLYSTTEKQNMYMIPNITHAGTLSGNFTALKIKQGKKDRI